MRQIHWLGTVAVLTACASAPRQQPTDNQIQKLLAQAKAPGFETAVPISQGSARYTVHVHRPEIAPWLKLQYSRKDIEALRAELAPALSFRLDERGLVRAAERVESNADDPTHYDAIWVRDSLWVYLSLHSNPAERSQAKQLLLTLSDYFSSPAQLQRFKDVIADPKILSAPDGAMNAVHIRFDRRSREFADVQEGGKPQSWNHKQNDALGLFLDLFCRAILEGEIRTGELTAPRREMVELFPRYFHAVQFDSMPDAGSWEEIERVNTSSIALVTSGLERLSLVRKYFPSIQQRGLAELIRRGYETIERQLAAGGESPGYHPQDPRYRTSDAALLNLIYPANLSRLKREHYEKVLAAVQPLIGEVGIKRYLGDSYQSGNFWFHTAKTDDTSSAESFGERGRKFLAGSEAQWFFDSWYSIALGQLGRRFGNRIWRAQATQYLNRALGQLTGGTPDKPVLGADANPVPPQALPESYNTIVDYSSGQRAFAPSPITPLNWSKAAMRIALDQFVPAKPR